MDQIVQCPNCGQRLSVAPEHAAVQCPRCGNVHSASSLGVTNEVMRAVPVASPPAPYPQAAQYAPAPPHVAPVQPAKSSSSGCLVASLIVGGVLVVGCLMLGGFGAVFGGGGGGGGGGAPAIFGGPQTLLSETEQVTDTTFRLYRFTLHRNADVRLSLTVTQGNGVTSYVMTQADYNQFENAQNALFGGQFHHYPAFNAENMRVFNTSGALGPNTYVLAVRESSSPNLLGGSDTAVVRIELVATPQ